MFHGRNNYTANIVICFLSIIIALFLLEIVTRKFYYKVGVAQITYKGDPLEGSSRFKISKDPILVYEWENLYQKNIFNNDKTAIRIIVLGDSTTNQGVWPLSDYYPALLENLLDKLPVGLQCEVLNAGVPGYNTVQEMHYFETRLLGLHPDIVILGYCAGNDRTIKRSIIRHKDGLYCSDVLESYPYISGFPFENAFMLQHSELYRLMNMALVRLAYKWNLEGMIKKIEYFDLSSETESAIRKFKGLSCKNKFYPLIVIFPLLKDVQRDYECDWIITKSNENNIDYIDLRDVFKKTGYENIKISNEDICHPNKFAHQLIAESIADFLRNKWQDIVKLRKT